MYRLLKNLDYGKHGMMYAGSVIPTGTIRPDIAAILEKSGAIARCEAPPLAVLPGWQARATKCKAAKIITADDFMSAESATLEACLSTDAATIERWRGELLDWFRAPAPAGG